jgi:site-specific DNA-methyltransferase (adenine-specific)
MTYHLHLGDCLTVLQALPDASVDSVVTDPPYGLRFMGKRWDYDVPTVEVWEQCLRVLKPGGHLLAFAGTRTQHRMAVRIEDAGFEIRDMIAWVYGSGFPKSLDVSKAIDGHVTGGRSDSLALRQVNETRPGEATVRPTSTNGHRGIVGSADAGPSVKRNAPATPEAQQWAGWGTALKPSLEPITVARKPFTGTVAANVLEHGTGALNIDGCRIPGEVPSVPQPDFTKANRRTSCGLDAHARIDKMSKAPGGRWPANLIHDGSDEVVGLFPQSTSTGGSGPASRQHQSDGRTISGSCSATGGLGDTGSAARFFYTSKASRDDRDPGNNHPTVKPTDLMRYLCRLVTPPGGIVLDPFMGSGSTGKAALLEGFGFVGIEREEASHAIAADRLARASAAGHQLGLGL